MNPIRRHPTELAPRAARRASAFLALAAILGAGCKTSDHSGSPQNTYVGREGDAKTDEDFGDPDLARKFVLQDIKTERRDDRLFVQFDLKNKTPRNLEVEWALEWFDARDFRIDAPRNWRHVVVGGEGFQTVAATAPRPEAVGFRLGVRRPSPVR